MRETTIKAAVLAVVLAGSAGPATGGDVERLAWLQGRWVGEKDGTATEESWTAPLGGALLGLHADVQGGRLRSWEFLRIDTTPEGTFYFASPRSAPPTAFKLVELSERQVVFENRRHDFPQRILYWMDAAGALHARIEGPQGDKTVSLEWVWTRALRP
jgi:hypothetical protein